MPDSYNWPCFPIHACFPAICKPAGTGAKQQKSSRPKPHSQGWLTGDEDEIGHRAPAEVLSELSQFEQHLCRVLERLDELIPIGQLPDTNTFEAVMDVCGWVHAEWVRMHPFANGNGRTARLWANYVAMRYGLPPFVRLRPRPDGDAYAKAGTQAMTGNWEPTARLFNEMLVSFLDDMS
ncbi:MAG: Fic family protein [Gammaproteobacteria bacterium]